MPPVPPVDAPVWCEVCQTETVDCSHLSDSGYLGEQLSRLHRLADEWPEGKPHAEYEAVIETIDRLQERHHRLTRQPNCDCHLCRDRGWFPHELDDEQYAIAYWRSEGWTEKEIAANLSYSKPRGMLRGFRQRVQESERIERQAAAREGIPYDVWKEDDRQSTRELREQMRDPVGYDIKQGIRNPDGSPHGPSCLCEKCFDPNGNLDDEYFFVVDGIGALVVGYREIPELLAQYPNARQVKK